MLPLSFLLPLRLSNSYLWTSSVAFPTTAKNQASLQLPVGNGASKAEAEPAGNPRQMAVGRKQQKYTGSVRLPTCHHELPDLSKTTFSGSFEG